MWSIYCDLLKIKILYISDEQFKINKGSKCWWSLGSKVNVGKRQSQRLGSYQGEQDVACLLDNHFGGPLASHVLVFQGVQFSESLDDEWGIC